MNICGFSVTAYLADWCSVLLLACLTIALEFVEPFQRYYFPDDESIAYPLLKETVPNWLLFIISFVAPLCLLTVISLVTKRTRLDMHNALLGLFVSLAFTIAFTQIAKVSAGRLRPNFLQRCLPTSMTPNAPCSNTDLRVVSEGRKSFPSGHSSSSFSGLGFLALYLAGKLKFHNPTGRFLKVIICLVPLVTAFLVAISRVDDYFHHWQDVLVGGLIGLICSVWVYGAYFPSIYARDSDNALERKTSDDTSSDSQLILEPSSPSSSQLNV